MIILSINYNFPEPKVLKFLVLFNKQSKIQKKIPFTCYKTKKQQIFLFYKLEPANVFMFALKERT